MHCSIVRKFRWLVLIGLIKAKNDWWNGRQVATRRTVTFSGFNLLHHHHHQIFLKWSKQLTLFQGAYSAYCFTDSLVGYYYFNK